MKTLLSQSGQVTTDFIYACIIILGTATLLGALTISLTLTEILQYISFAGSRSYFGADLNPGEQAQAGNIKVNELIKTTPFLIGAISNEWIKVTLGGSRDYSAYRDQIGAPDVPAKNAFVGYQIQFSLPLLNIKIPVLGEVAQPAGGNDLTTRVSSFLLREPTWDECVQFNRGIYKALRQKNPIFGQVTTSPGIHFDPESGFEPINDNGC